MLYSANKAVLLQKRSVALKTTSFRRGREKET